MNIRNFCIIAHIDHGKSTLADRLIEHTQTLEKREMKEQLLDTMDLERERGITIKLQPVRMTWKDTQLNLIDTPGHTDFRYEVSRSLAACEGAILLVDAAQGIQAQTLAVLHSALAQDLHIIPVLNKIDLPAADPERVTEEVVKLLGCRPEEVLQISAKMGTGVEALLDRIVEVVPSPDQKGVSPPPPHLPTPGGQTPQPRALIFDAVMDPYRGAIAYVRVMEGSFKKGQTVHFLGTDYKCDVTEVGHFSPMLTADPLLSAGEIGYIVSGAKDVSRVRTGDTITLSTDAEPLPGYQEVTPMVFSSLYPSQADGFPVLRESLEKLSLNDASLSFQPEHNAALGNGFRCGFLGLLHLDIIQERLEREFGCDLIVTAPGVAYEVSLSAARPGEVVRPSLLHEDDDHKATISNPADFPDPTHIAEVLEPWVLLEVVCRGEDIGAVIQLTQNARGVQRSTENLDPQRVLLTFEVPLQGIVMDYFDKLQSATSGFGSMNYEPLAMRPGDLVKLQIFLLGEPVDALSTIVHRSEAQSVGNAVCKKLKEVIPRAQFPIPVQAGIGAKVIARETVSAVRKDVTGHLYGGDVSRKKKLLAKQKEGKKRLKKMGKVVLSQEAFLSVLKR